MAVYGKKDAIIATNPGELARPYVGNEADRVAELVRSVQNGNTLTMIAVSDVHYREDADVVVNAIEDMSAAIGAIREQLHIDYCISYGDVIYACWGGEDGLSDRLSYADGVTDAAGVVKLTQRGFGATPQIRLVGNHDTNSTDSSGTKYFTMNQLFGYFGAHNGETERPDDYRNRSYGLIDDDYRKLRIIYLNTSDFGGGSPNKGNYGNLNYYMSAEQTAWLIDALDLSDKEDADEWQIVLMSHVPFDQSSTYLDGGMVKNGYPALLKAYEDGSSGSLLDVAYDFSGGKNAATLALFVHGHTHSYTVDNQHYRAGTEGSYTYPRMMLPRISIPNALPGRDTGANSTSDVGILWGVGEKCEKTAGTAESTAFVVNTLDPVSKVFYSHHYGAGFDRILHYVPQTISAATTLTPSITATSWATLDSSVATVNNSGKVTPKAAGNVMVYAKASDGTREYFNLSVSV